MPAQIHTLIENAKIIDGTGNPWFYGDIALSEDRIVDIAPSEEIPTENIPNLINANGLVACPGFIDIQSHAITSLMRDGRCLSKITQGITTEIMGETWTPAPYGGKTQSLPGEWDQRAQSWTRFRHWLEEVAASGVSPNIGSFLSGGTLRSLACGMKMDPATPEERDKMRRIMAEAMEDGAFGISYALIYPPDTYVQTDEIVDVCKVVSRYGGVYITHMRSEAARFLEAIEETLDIGRQADLPVEIYHLKASGQAYWHKMPNAIARIHRARAEGQDVTADMYPYAASGTGLQVCLPPWLEADGKFYDNLRDPDIRKRVKTEVQAHRPRDPETVMPIGFHKPEHRSYVGKRLPEIAAERNQDWVDTVIDLLLAENQRISTIYFTMSEDNLKVQLQQPWIKIATDAAAANPDTATMPIHPRTYGTYPRVLGKYVREENVIPLEDAIRKMTSAVANRLGLQNRGRVQTGCFADLVLFDPNTVIDHATFTDPHNLSEGIQHVWVNGTQVIANATHTGATPGRVVSGPT